MIKDIPTGNNSRIKTKMLTGYNCNIFELSIANIITVLNMSKYEFEEQLKIFNYKFDGNDYYLCDGGSGQIISFSNQQDPLSGNKAKTFGYSIYAGSKNAKVLIQDFNSFVSSIDDA